MREKYKKKIYIFALLSQGATSCSTTSRVFIYKNRLLEILDVV